MLLNIVLDREGDCPLYRQIARIVREAVTFGILVPGEQLPTLRQLAEMAHVNLHTVRHAYQVLKREGILTIIQGKGSFISTAEKGLKTVRSAVGWIRTKIDALLSEAKREGLNFPEVDNLIITLEKLILPTV